MAKKIGLTNSRGKQGFLSKSHMHELLQNPFYYGVMRVKKTGGEFPHRYETIISKSLFDQCQKVRIGCNKQHARYGGKEFLFRGMITCTVTGKLVVSDTKKRTLANGKISEWTYLIGYNPDNTQKKVWVREEKIIEEFEASLKTLSICEEKRLKNVLSYLNQTHDSKKREHRKHTAALKKEHTELEGRIEKLVELRINDEVEREEFFMMKKKFKDRQHDITELLYAYDVTDDEFNNRMNYIINIAANARDEFRCSSMEQKRELLKFVYSNIQMRGKKLKLTMAKPFDLIAECNETGEWRSLLDVIRTSKDMRAKILGMPISFEGTS